ncbi:hypothetical protein [Streptomyces sp. NPDC050704]|uniref:hypothetical protein n=1 Tax=Streptomyces sp. NPDC050704 TaxID=3157219 RepID=UPI003431ABAB
MAANFTSADLRRLADALDAMAAMSNDTGVTVTAYSDTQITANDHVIRIYWREADGEQPGHYLAEWPEG